MASVIHQENGLESKGMRIMQVSGVRVAVAEGAISLVEKITRKRCNSYIKNSCVPVKDFGSLFKSVASRFSGHLATIKENKLKKLCLPIMVPGGVDLPEFPDENADTLIVVSDGKWNGAILCSDLTGEAISNYEFENAKNGDVAGQGICADGSKFLVINVTDLLRREGFLAMV